MKRKSQQSWSTIPLISTQWTITSHLKSLNMKSSRHMTLEIKLLSWDRYKHVARWNWLIKSQPSLYENYQWLTAGLWFSPGTLVFCTNTTCRHDLTAILLKVAYNTVTLTLTLYEKVINLAIFVNISERDKIAALKRIQINYIVLFLLAISFFTIGGLGNIYLNNEKEWDISAWYQVYVGAFIAGGVVNT